MEAILGIGLLALVLIGGLFHLCTVLTGYYISAEKGRGGTEGFLLALLFGPFGLLLAVLMPAPARPVKPAMPVSSIVSLIAIAAFALAMVIMVAAFGSRPAPLPTSAPSRLR